MKHIKIIQTNSGKTKKNAKKPSGLKCVPLGDID